jgi:3-carboxy-cis,cis-muconate cycloisomerase
MAGDLMLMGRSEAGEARAGAAGGSSTMPNKANPVGVEAILTLARLAAALVGPLHQPHAEERDGPAWMLEWLVLPQILVATGACLRHAEALAPSLAPDPARMAALLSTDGGAAFAEAASFILAARMPRAEAQALVKRAVAAWPAETLAQALDRLAPLEGGWAAALAFDPAPAAAEARRALRDAWGGAPE